MYEDLLVTAVASTHTLKRGDSIIHYWKLFLKLTKTNHLQMTGLLFLLLEFRWWFWAYVTDGMFQVNLSSPKSFLESPYVPFAWTSFDTWQISSPLPTVSCHCVKVPLHIIHLTQDREGAVLIVYSFHQGETLTPGPTGYTVGQGGHWPAWAGPIKCHSAIVPGLWSPLSHFYLMCSPLLLALPTKCPSQIWGVFHASSSPFYTTGNACSTALKISTLGSLVATSHVTSCCTLVSFGNIQMHCRAWALQAWETGGHNGTQKD